MGKGAPDVNPNEEVARAEREADAIRGHLDLLLGELERRRRNALDMKRQARLHPTVAVGLGVALLAFVAGISALVVKRVRRHRVEARADRLREAWAIAREALLASHRR